LYPIGSTLFPHYDEGIPRILFEDNGVTTVATKTRRLLPGLHHKMSSPILLVARLLMFIAGRPLFPI
jgi:hypothetical protein